MTTQEIGAMLDELLDAKERYDNSLECGTWEESGAIEAELLRLRSDAITRIHDSTEASLR
jgi:hypothetical protein